MFPKLLRHDCLQHWHTLRGLGCVDNVIASGHTTLHVVMRIILMNGAILVLRKIILNRGNVLIIHYHYPTMGP
jgi:hypothetical protein